MADILLDEQSAPSTPSAGQGVFYPDSANSKPCYKDDSGKVWDCVGGAMGTPATAAQALGTSDTYVTGSAVTVPSCGLQVGSVYHVRLSLSKTGAGTQAPVWTVRLGTNGSTADTSNWTHTGVAQTAVAEVGYYELFLTVRSIGASGVLQGSLCCQRTGGTAATGLASVPVVEVTGAGASKTWASGQKIGLSITPGTSAAWTVTQCIATLFI